MQAISTKEKRANQAKARAGARAGVSQASEGPALILAVKINKLA